jgi:hypothetical protein
MIAEESESALTICGVRLVRQVLGDAADGIAHVVGGNGQIDGIGKFQRHAALAELRTGRDGFETADARDRAFDDLGQFLVDRLRRSAVECRAHGHDRPVDVGQLAHFHAHIGRKTRHHHQRVEDQRQDRTTHEKRGEGRLAGFRPVLMDFGHAHWAATLSLAATSVAVRTAPFSRTRCRPCVTI